MALVKDQSRLDFGADGGLMLPTMQAARLQREAMGLPIEDWPEVGDMGINLGAIRTNIKNAIGDWFAQRHYDDVARVHQQATEDPLRSPYSKKEKPYHGEQNVTPDKLREYFEWLAEFVVPIDAVRPNESTPKSGDVANIDRFVNDPNLNILIAWDGRNINKDVTAPSIPAWIPYLRKWKSTYSSSCE
jgi:hypothetical protein